MDVVFLLIMMLGCFAIIVGLFVHQTVYKKRQREKLVRRHHANKRKSV